MNIYGKGYDVTSHLIIKRN